ncbi:MAG TPA: lytic transglycosylase domain-containing protein [Chitinophagaceae bacterium]|nr:lytic transglycosylase domain-containing protein [Chitinophagaceae bacterium]
MKRTRLLLLGIAVLFLVSFRMPRNLVDTYPGGPYDNDTAYKEKAGDISLGKQSAVNSSAKNQGFNAIFETTGANGVKLNARAVSFVKDYMDKEGKNLEKMKSWGQPYFNTIDNILVQYGLPKELKYLAVIESELKSTAVSWVGAVGPWQLMPATARLLGLKVNNKVDERKNYPKSTHAAAKHLKDLYTEFGDWLLVIAAYNGGAGNVYSAIRKSGSRNFWKLQYNLPAESRTHVKKFIATHYIFEGQGGLTTLTKQEMEEQLGASAGLIRKLSQEEIDNMQAQNISGKYYSEIVARNILMEIDEFKRYNPCFDKLMANSSVYELKLPSDKMSLFVANKYQILNESVQYFLTAATDLNNSKTIASSK